MTAKSSNAANSPSRIAGHRLVVLNSQAAAAATTMLYAIPKNGASMKKASTNSISASSAAKPNKIRRARTIDVFFWAAIVRQEKGRCAALTPSPAAAEHERGRLQRLAELRNLKRQAVDQE